MSIYKQGTAALAANGTVTGTGTTWNAPLSLIRVGCTIAFLAPSVQLFTITRIDSATSMMVANPANVVIPNAPYTILLSDAISVDGLAQDVAETLRFYQLQNQDLEDQIDTKLTKGQNLADIPDKAQARNNLGVASSGDVLLKANNLGDLTSIESAKNNLGVGIRNDIRFGNMYLAKNNGTLSGILALENKNSQETLNVSMSRMWSELASGDYRTVIETTGNGAISYLIHNNQGVLQTLKYQATATSGAWGLDNDYRGTPFYLDQVFSENNYTPFIRGASASSGGYRLSMSMGIIAQGNSAWPQGAFNFFGDGYHQRTFLLNPVNGNIETYATAGQAFTGNYSFSKAPVSDRDRKKEIEYVDGKDSYDKVMKFKPSNFVYKHDASNKKRRGLIAQDLMGIDIDYVQRMGAMVIYKETKGGEEAEIDIDAMEDDTLILDSNVLMLDGLIALKYLAGKVEAQEKEIEELKSAVKSLLGK